MAKIRCPYVDGEKATHYSPNGHYRVICSATNCNHLGDEIDPEAGRLSGEVILRNCATRGFIDSEKVENILFGGDEKLVSGTITGRELKDEEVVDSSVEGVIRDYIAHSK